MWKCFTPVGKTGARKDNNLPQSKPLVESPYSFLKSFLSKEDKNKHNQRHTPTCGGIWLYVGPPMIHARVCFYFIHISTEKPKSLCITIQKPEGYFIKITTSKPLFDSVIRVTNRGSVSNP